MAAEEAIRQEMEGVNAHDPAASIKAYADNAVVYDPAQPQPLRGKEAIRKDGEEFFRAFPDVKMQVRRILDSGDRAAAEVTFTGTHKGPISGPAGQIAPTNRHVEFRGMAFFRFNPQGQVIEQRRYYDTGGFMRQLGITPGM